MLFEQDEDLELQPKRTKTVVISLGIHVLVLIFLVLNPDLLTSPPKRIIKVNLEDYDLSKENLTELVVPPDARPKRPVPNKPLVQPHPPQRNPKQQHPPPQQQPQPQPQQAPPPPPPPPPPKPQAPPPVIGPDDIIKEGARPDAPPNRASRGDTPEQARAGAGGQQQQQQQLPPRPESKAQQAQTEKPLPQIAQNTNPNALQLPGGNIMDSARKTVQQQMEEERRRVGAGPTQGPRTGLPAGQEDPDFSTEEPKILSDTHGYDFGPYMNQVVN